MKVLWFTGVQLPAVTGDDLTRAGWHEGLRNALEKYCPQIELGIASYGSRDYPSFRSGNATYFNVLRRSQAEGRLQRLVQNWKHHQVNDEELRRCMEIVKVYDPDLVYIFGTENPFGLLCNRIPKPSIISIQAVINGYKNKVFSGLPLWDILREVFHKKFILGHGVIHKKWRMQQQAKMERTIFRRCFNYDGRTAWDKSWLNRLNPEAFYYHIDRVLGSTYYKARWSPEMADPDLVYTTSSNAAFKGGITLVKSFIELQKRGRKDIRLRMAGVHPQSRVGKTIHRLIRKQGMEDQVTLLGRISSVRIIKEMQKASLFVLPSHIDNSPNSLAEAMILGMPCIASGEGGIPSMLEDGEEGLIFKHDDIPAIADSIEWMLDHPDRARSFGEKAREKALTRHNPERIADLVLAMYQDVLGRD